MNYREVAKKLSRLGCEEIPRHGGGSHRLVSRSFRQDGMERIKCKEAKMEKS